ncbi:MAG: hypothetical protein AABY22_16845 [Nanoarchaeota archaeon]
MELINYLWILPLIYLGLYLFFVFLKSYNNLFDKLIFCPVCGAWFFGLILGFIFNYPMEIIIFQIGMSATGIVMHLKEILHAKKQKFIFDFFLYQLIVTILGLLIIYLIWK